MDAVYGPLLGAAHVLLTIVCGTGEMPLARLTLSVIFVLGCSQHCDGQEPEPGLDGELRLLLPSSDAELIGGRVTKVSVHLALRVDGKEPIEYKAQIMVNACESDPFAITFFPGASGTAIVSWYVCAPSPSLRLQVKLTGEGLLSGKKYQLAEVAETFQVRAVLLRPYCTAPHYHRCYYLRTCPRSIRRR